MPVLCILQNYATIYFYGLYIMKNKFYAWLSATRLYFFFINPNQSEGWGGSKRPPWFILF